MSFKGDRVVETEVEDTNKREWLVHYGCWRVKCVTVRDVGDI